MAAGKSYTATEIRAGILVLTALIVTAAFISATTALRPTEKKARYVVYFDDTVGLNKGAEVRFGGVKVGKVTEIAPDPENQSRIRVEARIIDSTPVNEASEAYISQVTLTAQKHLAISTGSREAALVPDGGTIPAGGGDLFTALAGAAGGIEDLIDQTKRLLGTTDEMGNELPASEFGSVGDILLTLDEFFTDLRVVVGTRETDAEGVLTDEQVGDSPTIAGIMRDIKQASSDGEAIVQEIRTLMEDEDSNFNRILASAADATDGVKDVVADVDGLLTENKQSITNAIGSAESLLANLAETAESMRPELEEMANSLQAILDDAEVASGEVAVLLEKNGPTIEEIIFDVREMIRDLRVFAETLANDPNAFITGRGAPGRQ